MTNKLIFSILLITVALFSSCKKDKDNPTPEPNTPALTSPLLVVGNYWAFETIYVDENDNVSATTDRDSIFIEKDTLINGTKWFKQVTEGSDQGAGDHRYVYFFRDSSGILVNNYGVKLLDRYKTPGVVGNSLYLNGMDTIYESTAILQPQDTTIVLPAGTFKAKNVKTLYDIHINAPANRYKESTTLFYENWGIIIFSTHFNGTAPLKAHFEKRLVRYRVK